MDDPYHSDSSLLPSLCPGCQYEECKWEEHEDFLLELATALQIDETTTNGQKRFSMYRSYTLTEWGSLGAKNRKKIPGCVTEKIMAIFPSATGAYVGFKAGVGQDSEHSTKSSLEEEDNDDSTVYDLGVEDEEVFDP